MGGDLEHADAMFLGDSHAQATPEHHTDMVQLLRRIMRGRIVIAIVLMGLIGIPAGVGGYLHAKVLYRSRAQVYVRPNLKPILNPSGESHIPPMFSSYVKAQVSMLQSPGILGLARDILAEEVLKAQSDAERASLMSAATPASMRNGLRVVHRGGEEVIDVWFIHEDPVAAQGATNAVIAAFKRKYEERRKDGDTFRIETLRARVDSARSNAERVQKSIDLIGEEYGTTDLSMRRRAMVERGARLRNRVQEIEDQIRLLEQRRDLSGAGGDAVLTDGPSDALDLAMLAQQDSELARLVAMLESKSIEVDSMSSQFGPRHLTMRRLNEELSAIETRVNARRLLVENSLSGGGTDLAIGSGQSNAALLDRLLSDTNDDLEGVTASLRGLYDTESKIRDYNRELRGYLAKFEESSAALDRVNLEEAATESIGYVQTTEASKPSFPYSDKRRAYAILGGGAGSGMGLMLVIAWGLMHRKYRYIEDLTEPSFTAPLLGCLPDLSAMHSGHDEAAAWSVHQIRNLLEAKAGVREDRGNIYAVTSPQSGDGKTSLALALAMSMAKSGKRTLLVDLDLVGRGLTKQLRLGDAIGIRETILNEHVNGEISQTGVTGLSVLPAGRDTGVDESNLSSARLHKIMGPLTDQFDAVVVDTGPVLGSLEASLVCGLADGVLMTISRGQSESLVESSLQRVRWLGADCVGLVFNRATRRDLRKNHSFSASTSMRSSAEGNRARGSQRSALLAAIGSADADKLLGPARSNKTKRKPRR